MLDQIAIAWPDLRFERARLIDTGGDHRIVVLDESLAVRFPRRSGRSSALEAAALRRIAARVPVQVPRHEVSRDGRLACYRFLAGRGLTPVLFRALDRPARRKIANQLGTFLSALHALEPAAVAPLALWPRPWTPAQYAAHARRELLPRLHALLPTVADRAERFYDRYEHDAPDREVVLHGDLVPEHILLGRDRDVLSGIIDFADMGLGDPAHDLAGLWHFGEVFVRSVISAYVSDVDDGELIARSRRAYVRYSLDRLMDRYYSEGPQHCFRRVSELEEVLRAIGHP